MRYEVNDYRKLKPPPSWLDWQPIAPAPYIMKMIAFLFFLPYLFGVAFSPLGLFMNCLLIDYILYYGAITRREY